jgi:hypothetical protein
VHQSIASVLVDLSTNCLADMGADKMSRAILVDWLEACGNSNVMSQDMFLIVSFHGWLFLPLIFA